MAGEPQLVFNYVHALSTFLINFTFTKGVNFHVDRAYQHITPALLDRAWDRDNNKSRLLWEIGQFGSIFGDPFVKVSYINPYFDTANVFHEGRVVIIPMNPAYCFPVWHPHERGRMIEFKQKYKFWSCVDPETEALTKRGWKHYWELQPDDELLTIDPETDAISWDQPSEIKVMDYEGDMVRWSGRVDAFATPNHRWLGEVQRGRGVGGSPGKEHKTNTLRYERMTINGEFVREVRKGSRLVTGGGTPLEFRTEPKWTNELVETVGWYLTEGSDHFNQTGYHSIHLSQSEKHPQHVATIKRLQEYWRLEGGSFNENAMMKGGVHQWYLGKGVKDVLEHVAPNKELTPRFLTELTYHQAQLLRDTLIAGDGHRVPGKNSVKWTQLDDPRKDGYQMLCAMLGIRSKWEKNGEKVQEYYSRYSGTRSLNETREHYKGKVWCPAVRTGYFMARRGTSTYWTGNTMPDGTRIIRTYTEIITDDWIKEYVDNELIRENENPLGKIPVVHIPNQIAPGSPWGLSDIWNVIPINRQYNETATDLQDIINYYASPVTVITGSKPNNAIRGPNKIWAYPDKETEVFNLDGGFQGADVALRALDGYKRSMHEMSGVPENALGQEQAVSNTSGVSLAIQYLPTMNIHHMKAITYGEGFREINKLILLTLFTKEPNTVLYDPNTDGIMERGQASAVDPADPRVYDTYAEFQPPLPIDAIVKLEELKSKAELMIISRRGMLKELGAEFPDEMLEEIFEENVTDAQRDGSMRIIKSYFDAIIAEATGMVPEGSEQVEPEQPPTTNADGSTNPGTVRPEPIPAVSELAKLVSSSIDRQATAEIVTRAMQPRVPMMRHIDQEDDTD